MDSINSSEPQQCKFCGSYGSDKFCASCGHSFTVKRISFQGMVHEAFHFFTHFDKGFPYTLKKLAVAPGTMQREYIDGVRNKNQKPFSMFFLCATFAAIALYWINLSIVKDFHAGDAQETVFFNKYWVMLQVCMLPLYALITYIFFKDSGLNYGEVVVLQLYVFSFIFLLLTLIHLLKFIAPHLQTRYIELPVLTVYAVVTNFNFFKGKTKWVILLKSIVTVAITFFIASSVQDLLVKTFLQH